MSSHPQPTQLPVIDLALEDHHGGRDRLAAQLDLACREFGFFYVTGHGIDTSLVERLMQLSRSFFALDDAEKRRIHMSRGGRAWRGYFAVGDELTSGYADRKEGILRNGERWFDVPDVPNSFVCNVGDMLERLTRGRCLSALHRVRNPSEQDRLSMAFFFDPSFDAHLAPIEGIGPERSPHTRVRWDEIDPNAPLGTYGDYLLAKVAKVFPDLHAQVRRSE